MTDLAKFLLARCAEDEAGAELIAALPGGDLLVAALPQPIFGFIVRHGPARVLAECDAKRRIVAAFREHVEPDEDGVVSHREDDTFGSDGALRDTCRLLAQPYADHPDYQQEWKP